MAWVEIGDVLKQILKHLSPGREVELDPDGPVQMLDGRFFAPDSSIGPKHKHLCKTKDCGFLWEHNDLNLIVSTRFYEELHTCPKCGAITTYRYNPDRGWFGENEDGTRKTAP